MNFNRAAARFVQIAEIEQTLQTTEQSIAGVQHEIDQAEERLHELRKVKNELLRDLRTAARDEGELPLVDLMERLAAMGGT